MSVVSGDKGAPENPSAFPREDYQADDAPGQRGMSLRDWFAGQALATVVALVGRDVGTADDLAKDAYIIADAMLRAREQSK